MNILLLNTEGESKVNEFEDTVLTGPENVRRFEISVDYAVLMESVESHQNILSKLQTGPGRQASPLVLINDLEKGRNAMIKRFCDNMGQ